MEVPAQQDAELVAGGSGEDGGAGRCGMLHQNLHLVYRETHYQEERKKIEVVGFCFVLFSFSINIKFAFQMFSSFNCYCTWFIWIFFSVPLSLCM